MNEKNIARTRFASWRNRLLLLLLCVALAFIFWRLGPSLSPSALAAREGELKAFVQQYPHLALPTALVGYAAITGLSLPGAAVMSVLLGKLLGFAAGFIVVSFGSTLGASIAFLLCRYFLRDAARSLLGERFTAIDNAVKKDGAMYLFTLRLQPVFPFWLVNLAMGLTPISLGVFWWVSQLGMAPATAAFVYAGSTLPDLSVIAEKGASGLVSWKLLVALALLGLLPWCVRGLLAAIVHKSENTSSLRS